MKKCKFCEKELTNEKNIFCDSSCAAKYNNPIYGVKPPKLCLYCGKELKERANSYCNLKCCKEHYFKIKTLPLFYAGGIKHNSTLRKVLMFLFGNECQECGTSNKWNGKLLTFEVHHKDGNSDNNFPENLLLLCPNCHSQTGTYNGKSKNTKRNKYFRSKYKAAIV
jgi:hypothetical protein